MTNSIEMASIDDQIPRIPQTEKDEIEEGSKVDHSININEICAKKFKDLVNSSIKSRTMFKVNVWQRESNPDAYTPKMVSIGPYHKRDVQLHRMENYKWLYLQRFLGRKEGLDVESCIKELEKLKEKAINCYEDVEDNSQFCQMLLLDGCFVVEFIREHWGMCPEGEDKIINDNIIGYIVRDLLLLENQLPFFILDELHYMTQPDYESFAKLVCEFFSGFVDLRQTINGSIISEGTIKHLLNLLHILSRHGNSMKMTNYGHDWLVMPNATQLSEAGVRFDMHWDSKSIFDIKFENGLISIPQFRVTGNTETLLRNLIAYEQQSVDIQPKHFSDFAIFMDCLIKSDKDVTLLGRKRIITMKMGTEKQVANLFNKIASEVPVSPHFYYNEELGKATDHHKKRRNKVNFRQYYFSSRWVGVSTLAAAILLILTAMQTVLAFINK